MKSATLPAKFDLPRNHPVQDDLLLSLRAAAQAGRDWLKVHPRSCRCQFCHDVRGILYQLEAAENTLVSQLHPAGEEERQRFLELIGAEAAG